jgi:tetratricopeptide (TPR) repeat protein
MIDIRVMDQLKSLGYVSGAGGRSYELTGTGIDPKDAVGILDLIDEAESSQKKLPEKRRIELLQQALVKDPQNPSLYYQLGGRLEKNGRYDDAMQLYRVALSKGIESARLHSRIADHLARAGLPLLAQHVDPIDPGTLVDIFRDDPRASLLGTDALRDGVDVPGESLRLVVMERVPWPRPTVLHAARRMAGGGSAYDDAVVRARLAQAFGRLIRREGDRGTFVILSAAMPSRLLSAFPRGVPIQRVPLDEALAHVATAATVSPVIQPEAVECERSTF